MANLEKPGAADVVVRAQPELVSLCKTLDINMSEIARTALAREVRRRSRASSPALPFARRPLEYTPPPRQKRKRQQWNTQ